ncbi:major facilitator superfamily domain-containing protein 12-like [Tubulanus polymorphus]|uniref:major facilitator superfamily domain-containing protein 12-like n=1 Tax=Tubulanus polymorphus TaxID=672921 RepID=UPI003DA4A91A
MGIRQTIDKLPFLRKLSFSVGHVMNDLCASIWFSYSLVYYRNVAQFSNYMAGYMMLLGQIADAIATPLVGYEADHTEKGFCGYSKRKSWHLVGTLCVALSFPFIYNLCITCENAPDWSQFIYYAPFVVIFQFGWATTQISFLSLIPVLTPYEDERVELNAMSYAFTVISNVAVYGLTWLLLNTNNDDAGKMKQVLGRADAPTFGHLALIVIGIGLVFSAIFHFGTNESRQSSDSYIQQQSVESIESHSFERSGEKLTMKWTCWLKLKQFYLVSVLYMCTRLVVNISQIYLPLFLLDALKLDKVYMAIIPLMVFVSGFLTSMLMKVVNRMCGRKITYFIGLLTIYGACIWFYCISLYRLDMQIFGAAVLLGSGCSTILITSLSMTADLISENTETGAFVYGAMSFTDKLSNGITVVFIQRFYPCLTCCVSCHYRNVMAFVPGGVGLVALIVLLCLVPQKIGDRSHLEAKMRLRPVDKYSKIGVEEEEEFKEEVKEEEPLCKDQCGAPSDGAAAADGVDYGAC